MKIINNIIILQLVKAIKYNFEDYLDQADNVTEIVYKLGSCTSIDGQNIKKFKNLRKLVISNTLIDAFPLEVCELERLEYLDLSNNKIKEIPKGIRKLQSLLTLNLEGNSISTIPEELCSLKNLSVLNLSNNKIRCLPSKIENLFSLTEFSLNNNLIRDLIKEICNLQNLKSLKLSDNRIKTVPREIGNMTGLRILGLNSNKISKLPIEISLLQNLVSLLIDDNELTSFPLEICLLNRLRILSMANNPIQSILNSKNEIENFRSEYENFKAANYGNFKPFSGAHNTLSSADCIKILDEKMKMPKLGIFNLEQIDLIAFPLDLTNQVCYFGTNARYALKSIENEYDLKIFTEASTSIDETVKKENPILKKQEEFTVCSSEDSIGENERFETLESLDESSETSSIAYWIFKRSIPNPYLSQKRSASTKARPIDYVKFRKYLERMEDEDLSETKSRISLLENCFPIQGLKKKGKKYVLKVLNVTDKFMALLNACIE